jgi:hypothetical protein
VQVCVSEFSLDLGIGRLWREYGLDKEENQRSYGEAKKKKKKKLQQQ